MGQRDTWAYSGHEQLRGVWGGSPDAVPVGYAHQAANRFFREDYNRTRPSIRNIQLEFATEADRIWFQGANGQGATFYNSYPSFLSPVLVASIGGRIFTVSIQGTKGVVRQLYDGNSRQFQHAWFAQGFQWLVIQDGIHPPIFWDGTNAPRRSDIAKNEMPIGSVMAYIWGRFVVASSDGKNQIFVGDIAFGDTVTNPNNILNFTEQTYWAEGGSFITPSFIGDVQGMYAMPFLDTGTGQNELVIGCTAGFSSLDLSTPRTQWLDQQTQKVALIGDGLASSHGFAGLNGDMFFRSFKGINSYRNARIEYSQRWNQTPVSREVNYWLKPDRTDYLQYVPMVSWQNMLLTGVSPFVQAPNNPAFGFHRYCRGMVVFDADSMSTAGRDGQPVWHGMWSGIRPWAFAQGMVGNADRCFAFSFDRDGRNRLYELTLENGDDQFISNAGEFQTRKIEGFYTTSLFGGDPESGAFKPKKLNGGCLEFSEVLSASVFSIEYRPDGSPCWVPVDRGEPGCDCPERPTCEEVPNRPLTALPQWGRKYFEAVNPKECMPGTKQPAAVFHHCQAKVKVIGSLRVDRLNVRFDPVPDPQIAECVANNCVPIDCCPNEGDFSYNIAPAGTNNEVPPVPEDIVKPFLSTRFYRAVCPNFPAISVVAVGQAQSFISQADADAKAQQAAQANAQQQLVCPDCTPNIESDNILTTGQTEDYSPFLMAGLYTGLEGKPVRIINAFNDELITYGVVNLTGTIELTQFFTTDYDQITNIYTYPGPGSGRMTLQRGCNPNGENQWPVVPSYY